LTQPESKTRLAFGPFEVNAQSGELFKHGARVRLSKQPFQVLLALLARRGDLVTRDQLLAELWDDGTFVDFEHSLNAAINRLRQSLGDSAEKPRYIETVPGQGYRFIGALEYRGMAPVSSTPVPSITGPAIAEGAPGKRNPSLWWPLAAAVLCLVVLAVWWRFGNSQAPPSVGRPTRLTADAGLSGSPALSPDGKLLAYSSDRNLSSDRNRDGAQDLYIQQVAGGQPIRLTFDGAGNTTPDFSPDGSKIVFRSNRNGGGIYEIPAFGGDSRLLARDGLNPRYSPDGSQVAYWVGAENISDEVPGTSAVWVVPSSGGQPQRVGSNFTAARAPIWSADGKRLLIIGYTSAKAYDGSSLDWFLLVPNGGPAVKTGAYDVLVHSGLHRLQTVVAAQATLPGPGCWPVGDTVIFSAMNGGSQNLWEIGISPRTGKVTRVPRRLTTGAGSEVDPSCASAGALAFTNAETRRDVWSLPFELDRGTSSGALERLTQGLAFREHVSLSNDGRAVAFASDQSGRMNIWTRDLATGKESRVAGSSFIQRYPVSNAAGSRIAFSVFEGNGKRVVYVAAPGGAPEKLCEGCLRATDWSGDEKTLLVFGGNPYQINALDASSHRQSPLVKHPDYNLLYARFSPDNRWVSFTARIQPSHARIMIAPLDGPKPVPKSDWITIAEAGVEDWANWSPDGKTLYFTSGRDGHDCLWGQRLEPGSHRPMGEAFAVQHLHGRLSYQQGGWSAAGGRIGMALVETTGNIWMMSRSDAR
jgi:Tol biopolymer transport system component/DNA-binding winged helix-turn-helix (wHTH) protein